MPRVFEITPKRIKRSNNMVLTPEMKVTVTTNKWRFWATRLGHSEKLYFTTSSATLCPPRFARLCTRKNDSSKLSIPK